MSPPCLNAWQMKQQGKHHHGTSESQEHHPVSCFAARWMADVNDNASLSSLTIPGTHDSAAYTCTVPFVSTQTLKIPQQLDASIRHVDLRCGNRDNSFQMVHSHTSPSLALEQVLATLYDWLDTHPTEALVVQIKEDGQAERSTATYTAISGHNAARTKVWRTVDTTPNMSELRGKIKLFQRFPTPNPMAYGNNVTEWMNNPRAPFTIRPGRGVQLTDQDHYDFPDPVALSSQVSTKSDDVSSFLNSTTHDLEAGQLYSNLDSASEFNLGHQISPQSVAVGGYSLFRWIAGLHPRLASYMKAQKERRRFGIVVTNLPQQRADDLVHALVMSNFQRETSLKAQRRMVLCLMVLITLFVSFAVGFGMASVGRVANVFELTEEAANRDLILAASLNT